MDNAYIENYELPQSEHYAKGMVIYFIIAVVSCFMYIYFDLSLLVIHSITIAIAVINYMHWTNKDKKACADHENQYIEKLDSISIEQIKLKINNVGSDSLTGTFLTYYIQKRKNQTK
jgi:membrane-anchored protein YejM (alkaline phosphatase superfamily)